MRWSKKEKMQFSAAHELGRGVTNAIWRKKVPYDKFAIPTHMRNDARLVKADEELDAWLLDPLNRKRSCVHEAAHEMYYNEMGAQLLRKGPQVFYDTQHDQFKWVQGAVVGGFRRDQAWSLKDRAKAMAAGGVAALILTNSPIPGDAHDISDFTDLCKKEFGFSDNRIAAEWKEAQDAVRKDLNSPARRREIYRIATEFEQEIYGPYFEERFRT